MTLGLPLLPQVEFQCDDTDKCQVWGRNGIILRCSAWSLSDPGTLFLKERSHPEVLMILNLGITIGYQWFLHGIYT